MSWDFTILDMDIVAGRSAPAGLVTPRDDADSVLSTTKLAPPWESLEGLAEADNGRNYGWDITTLAAYLQPAAWLEDESPAPCVTFPELGRADIFVTEAENPVVLVDRPSFGPDLLDLLRISPPALRPRWLVPVLTHEEQAWLDDLEAADVAQQLPLALSALTTAFGEPLRIEAGQAALAVRVLSDAGYVLSPEPLLNAYRHCFSTKARQIIRAGLAG